MGIVSLNLSGSGTLRVFFCQVKFGGELLEIMMYFYTLRRKPDSNWKKFQNLSLTRDSLRLQMYERKFSRIRHEF